MVGRYIFGKRFAPVTKRLRCAERGIPWPRRAMRFARGDGLNKMRRRANKAGCFESERRVGANAVVDDMMQTVLTSLDDLYNT